MNSQYIIVDTPKGFKTIVLDSSKGESSGGTPSKTYQTFGAALYPFYMIGESAANCTVKMPSDPSIAVWLYYLSAVDDYTKNLNKDWLGPPRHFKNFINEFDRELNNIWNQYQQTVSRFSSSLIKVSYRVQKGQAITRVRRGRYITNNVNALLESIFREANHVSKLKEVAPQKIKDTHATISNTLSSLEERFNEFVNNFGGEEKYGNVQRTLSGYYEEQRKIISKLSQLDWGPAVKILGTGIGLTVGAVIAYFTLGTGTVTVPFICGFVVAASSTIIDTVTGYRALEEELEISRNKLQRFVQSQEADEYAVYSIMYSYIKSARMALLGLKSSEIALNNFVDDNANRFQDLMDTINKISLLVKDGRKLNGDDIINIKKMSYELSNSWKFEGIQRYFEVKEPDDLYCFRMIHPKYVHSIS